MLGRKHSPRYWIYLTMFTVCVTGLLIYISMVHVEFSARTSASVSSASTDTMGNAGSAAVTDIPHVPENAEANGDWPQLQHDPQRTGYTSETVTPPFRLAWYHNFQPERIGRDVQAIVCTDKVFVPTQSGNLYALDTATGLERWVYDIGSPVLHTAACEDGKVVVATLDGSVSAVDAEAGTRVWRFEADGHTGFSAAPLIAEGMVFIGERSGILYALDLADGTKKWGFDAKAPIFNTAAYNDGRVYFCDEAMYVHALDSQTGAEIWVSDQLYGQSCKQYHPVVYQGYVMIRPMMTHQTSIAGGIYPFNRTWNRQEYETRVSEYAEFLYASDPIPQALVDAQDDVVQYYIDHPYEQSFFVLYESDGQQAFIPPHFHQMTLPGPPTPPVADGRGGVIIPWSFIGFGWARLDLQARRVDDIILPPPPSLGGDFWGGNPDESVNASVGGSLLYIFHAQEGNAQWTGIFDWSTRQFHRFGFNSYGLRNRWWQLTDNDNNGNNSVSIADGHFYHITFHQIAAWTTE